MPSHLKPTDTPVKALLRRVVLYGSGDKPKVHELAELIGISPRTVYSYMEAEKTQAISADDLAIISRYFAAEYRNTRIAAHFLPEGSAILLPNGEGKLDGQIVDQVVSIDVTQADAIRAWEARDYDAVVEFADRLIAHAQTMKREAQEKLK